MLHLLLSGCNFILHNGTKTEYAITYSVSLFRFGTNMKIKTFWIIIIKLFGIGLLAHFLVTTVRLATLIVFPPSIQDNSILRIVPFFLFLFNIGFYVVILHMIFVNPDKIISFLKLEEKFEEENLDININIEQTLTIATIIVGGVIFIWELPNLSKNLFYYYQQTQIFRYNLSSKELLFSFIKVAIGFIILTNSNYIVKFIERNAAAKIDDIDNNTQ